MAPLGVGVTVDLDVVRRIEERRVDRGAVADDGTEEHRVAAIAAADAVLAADPDIAGLRPWVGRHRGDELVVGIGLTLQHDVDLAAREPGQRQVEIDIENGKLGELELEDVEVPPRAKRELVVGKAQRALLRVGQVRQRDRRHRAQPDQLCSEEPPVPGDDPAVAVDQDRIGKPERPDRAGDLLDLLLRVGPRIAWIWDQARRGAVGEDQGLAITVGEHNRGVCHGKEH